MSRTPGSAARPLTGVEKLTTESLAASGLQDTVQQQTLASLSSRIQGGRKGGRPAVEAVRPDAPYIVDDLIGSTRKSLAERSPAPSEAEDLSAARSARSMAEPSTSAAPMPRSGSARATAPSTGKKLARIPVTSTPAAADPSRPRSAKALLPPLPSPSFGTPQLTPPSVGPSPPVNIYTAGSIGLGATPTMPYSALHYPSSVEPDTPLVQQIGLPAPPGQRIAMQPTPQMLRNQQEAREQEAARAQAAALAHAQAVAAAGDRPPSVGGLSWTSGDAVTPPPAPSFERVSEAAPQGPQAPSWPAHPPHASALGVPHGPAQVLMMPPPPQYSAGGYDVPPLQLPFPLPTPVAGSASPLPQLPSMGDLQQMQRQLAALTGARPPPDASLITPQPQARAASPSHAPSQAEPSVSPPKARPQQKAGPKVSPRHRAMALAKSRQDRPAGSSVQFAEEPSPQAQMQAQVQFEAAQMQAQIQFQAQAQAQHQAQARAYFEAQAQGQAHVHAPGPSQPLMREHSEASPMAAFAFQQRIAPAADAGAAFLTPLTGSSSGGFAGFSLHNSNPSSLYGGPSPQYADARGNPPPPLPAPGGLGYRDAGGVPLLEKLAAGRFAVRDAFCQTDEVPAPYRPELDDLTRSQADPIEDLAVSASFVEVANSPFVLEMRKGYEEKLHLLKKQLFDASKIKQMDEKVVDGLRADIARMVESHNTELSHTLTDHRLFVEELRAKAEREAKEAESAHFKEVQALRADVDRVTKAVKLAEMDMSTLQSENARIRDEVIMQRDAKDSMEARYKGVVAALEGEVAEGRAKLQAAVASFEADMEALRRMKVENEDWRQQRDAIVKLFEEETQTAARSRLAAVEAADALESEQKATRDLHKLLHELRDEVAQLKGLAETRRKRIGDLEDMVRDRDRLEDLTKQQDRELRGLSERLDEVRSETEALERTKDAAIDSLQGDVLRLETDWKLQREKLSEVTRRLEETEGRLNAKNDQIEQLRANWEATETLCARARAEAHDAISARRTVEQELTDAQLAGSHLKDELMVSVSKVQNLEREFDAYRAAMGSEQLHFKQIKAQLEARIDDLRTERDRLDAELRKASIDQRSFIDLKPAHDRLQNLFNDLESSYAALQEQYETRVVQHESLVKTNMELQFSFEELHQRTSKMSNEYLDVVAQMESTAQELGATRQRLIELTAAHEATLAEMNVLTVNFKTRGEELEITHQRLKNMTGLQDRTQNVLEDTRAELQKQKDVYEHYIRSNEIERKNARLAELEEMISDPLERIPAVTEALLALKQALLGEVQARKFRERYSSTVNNQLQHLERQLERLHGMGKMTNKGSQTDFVELWARNRTATAGDEGGNAIDAVVEIATDWVGAYLSVEDTAAAQSALSRNAKPVVGRGSMAGGAVAPPVSPNLSVGDPNRPGVLSLQATMQTISDIYAEKFSADLAAARFGLAPRRVEQFVHDLFLYRFGLPRVAMAKLMGFARSVMAHTQYGPVAKFALTCGLLKESDIPVTVDNMHAFPLSASTARSANAVIYVSPRMTNAIERISIAEAQQKLLGASGALASAKHPAPAPDGRFLASMVSAAPPSRGRVQSPTIRVRVTSSVGLHPNASAAPQDAPSQQEQQQQPAASAPAPASSELPVVPEAPDLNLERARSDLPMRPAPPGPAVVLEIAGPSSPLRTHASLSPVKIKSERNDARGALAAADKGPAPPSRARRRSSVVEAEDVEPLPPWMDPTALRDEALAPVPYGAEGISAPEYDMLPVELQWQFLTQRYVRAARARRRPRLAPNALSFVHSALGEAIKAIHRVPGTGHLLQLVKEGLLSKVLDPPMDLGALVTDMQLPQLHHMYREAALIMHIDKEELPLLFIKNTREPIVMYLEPDVLGLDATAVYEPAEAPGPRGAARDRRTLRATAGQSLNPNAALAGTAMPQGPPRGAEMGSRAALSLSEGVFADAQGRSATDQIRAQPKRKVKGVIVLGGCLVDLLQPHEVQAVLASALMPVAVKVQSRLSFDLAACSPLSSAPPISAEGLAQLPTLLTACAVIDLCPALPTLLGTSAAAQRMGKLSFSLDTLRNNWPMVASAFQRFRSVAALCMDRSALTVAQDVGSVLSVALKVASGSSILAQELNPDALLEQARMSDLWNLGEDHVAEMIKRDFTALTSTVAFSSAILRARELQRWATERDYAQLLEGAIEASSFM